MDIEMQPVSSSMVDAVGYDAASQTLRVDFSGGATYDYNGVPPAKYAELMASGSVGKFVNTQIKGTYNFTRV